MPAPILALLPLLVGYDIANKKLMDTIRIESLKEGHEKASKEYEQKLRDLTEYFMKERKVAADKFAEYEELLRMYEELIKEMERRQSSASAATGTACAKNKNEIQALKEIKDLYNELVSLEKCS